jgi:hypothetical protein
MDTTGIEFTFSLRTPEWSEAIRITDIEDRECYVNTAGAVYDSLVADLELKRKKLNEKPST